MMMREELLREIYESVDKVNKTLIDEELTDFTKNVIIKEEEAKQVKLREFLTEWETTERHD